MDIADEESPNLLLGWQFGMSPVTGLVWTG
jgi:hypothetical protein